MSNKYITPLMRINRLCSVRFHKGDEETMENTIKDKYKGYLSFDMHTYTHFRVSDYHHAIIIGYINNLTKIKKLYRLESIFL